MKAKTIRNWAFTLHRYIGLVLGLLLIVICVTGGLLVFSHETDAWIVSRQFGVIPQGEMISINTAIKTAKAAYPQWKIQELTLPEDDRHPFALRAVSPDSKDGQIYLHGIYIVYVNPYTGKVMGDRAERFTVYRFLLNLHYRLFLPGDWIGRSITGIAALLLLTLAITGIILWPGWHKLSTGFKIKWNAHIKRRNFDLHKVAGITTAVFLAFTGFTGAYLSFYYQVTSAIDALTSTPSTVTDEPVPTISVQPGQSPLSLDTLLQKAQQTLPEMKLREFYFPEGEPFEAYGRADESVWLDPYTAKVLAVDDGKQKQERPLSDRIFRDVIAPLHFGTFGGLPTRILYVFVGLAPLILFITGLVMWRYRYRGKAQLEDTRLRERIEQKL